MKTIWERVEVPNPDSGRTLWTYRNTETGKTLDKKFVELPLWNIAKKEDGSWVYVHPKTQKEIDIIEEGLFNGYFNVKIAEEESCYSVFNANTGLLNVRHRYCTGDYDMKQHFEYILDECPEDFVHLPTAVFRPENKDLLNKFTIATRKGLENLCAKDEEVTEEIQKRAEKVIEMMKEKIELEKETIELEDKEKESKQERIAESQNKFKGTLSEFDKLFGGSKDGNGKE
ncbi:MAG: hypothetical protein ACI4R8_03750 [Candidatus Caccovivens sp.]